MVEKTSRPMAIEIASPHCPTLIFMAIHGQLLALLCGIGFVAAAICLYAIGAGAIVSIVVGGCALPVWFLMRCLAELCALLVDTLVPR